MANQFKLDADMENTLKSLGLQAVPQNDDYVAIVEEGKELSRENKIASLGIYFNGDMKGKKFDLHFEGWSLQGDYLTSLFVRFVGVYIHTNANKA